MEEDPKIPPIKPADNAPPPLAAPLSSSKPRKAAIENFFCILLSLSIAIFLADAFVSFVDESSILFFNVHYFTVIRGLLFLLALIMAVVIYVLMGLTPLIPKSLFLPIVFFNPLAGLIEIPFLIYSHSRVEQVAWGISVCQIILGLAILGKLQNGFRFRWPLLTAGHLGIRRFSWRNSFLFLLANLFVLLPIVLTYFAFCGSLAINHFSEGFVTLRWSGLIVQVRNYVRDDGKTIQLVPMAHVGDSKFYQKLSRSFPTNSIVLMEGVTDNRNLLTNKISYKRMAATLGLAEQQKEFVPQAEMVRADVDVDEFTTNTIDFLNLVMLFHSKGVNADSILKMIQYVPPPGFEKQLWNDLLHKRNRRLLQEIQTQLSQSDKIIVPWGAAHMPEIAREIEKSGFRLKGTMDYAAIRFGSDRR